MIEPVIENQISSIFAERKMSNKLKKELQKSTTQFTPEKREFYKDIIKKLYIKWKPLIDESINEAETIKNVDIVEELSLPPVKIHCSVLAEDAIKAAIKDYKSKNGYESV